MSIFIPGTNFREKLLIWVMDQKMEGSKIFREWAGKGGFAGKPGPL
jgi:hypothetical protein